MITLEEKDNIRRERGTKECFENKPIKYCNLK